MLTREQRRNCSWTFAWRMSIDRHGNRDKFFCGTIADIFAFLYMPAVSSHSFSSTCPPVIGDLGHN